MLIKLTKLEETDLFYEGEKHPIAVDPVMIEQVEPVELADYDGPVCKITLTSAEAPFFVEGNVEFVMRAVNAAELSALDKLDEIRAILNEGGRRDEGGRMKTDHWPLTTDH